MLSPRGGGRARKLTDKAFEKLRDEFPWLERHPAMVNAGFCHTCNQTVQLTRDKLTYHNQNRVHTVGGVVKDDIEESIVDDVNVVTNYETVMYSQAEAVVVTSAQEVEEVVSVPVQYEVAAPHQSNNVISISNVHMQSSHQQVVDVSTMEATEITVEQLHNLAAGGTVHLQEVAVKDYGQQNNDMTLIDANQTVTTSFANNIVTTPIVKRAAIPSSGVKYTVKTFERWKEEFPWIERHPTESDLLVCRACQRSVQPKRDQIMRHGETKLHMEATELMYIHSRSVQQSTIDIKESDLHNVQFDVIRAANDDELSIGVINASLGGSSSAVAPPPGFSKVKSNAPPRILAELKMRLMSGHGHDVIWKSERTSFKAHKIVLSLFSPMLKNLMSQDSVESEIQTPDISCATVKSILCLFYTGTVVLKDHTLASEIESALTLLGCSGKVTIEKVENKLDLLPFFSERKRRAAPVSFKNKKKKGNKRGRKKVKTEAHEFDEMMENYLDQTHMEEIQDQDDMDYKPPAVTVIHETDTNDTKYFNKSEQNDEIVKIEVEDQIEEVEWKTNPDWYEDDIFDDKENDSPGEFDDLPEADVAVCTKTGRRLREKLCDSKYRYHLKGNRLGRAKGPLSLALKDDLFDDAPENLVGISVCPFCYGVFKTKKAHKIHVQTKHQDEKHKRPAKGPYYISETKYKCPTCNKEKDVLHLVWFVKHMRYCGKDDDKANAILGPKDKEVIPNTDELSRAVGQDEFVFVVNNQIRGKKIQVMCREIFGKVPNSIWGCRTCYEFFLTRADLDEHREKEHNGKLIHGPCYDEENKSFTCLYCKTVFKSKTIHLVTFIRHMKTCLIDNGEAGKVCEDDDEGLEDDTTEDVIDPWGIISKPFKVINQKSNWICESLFGKYVPVVYPCHVCYTPFPGEHEIKEHFATMHPNIENCVENGPQYDRNNDSFNCPVCHKDVCKGQKKTSLYFIHHYMKCLGTAHNVYKTCPKCNKTLGTYRSYSTHVQNNCRTEQFMCHICSMVVQSKQRLKNHVQYVHSDARPYMCPQCPKNFKRKMDLQLHEETHNTVLSFSCDECGKAFHRKKNLKTHMQTHVKDEDKPHACPYCPLRFVRKQVFTNHLATHGVLPSYDCNICSSQLKTREALRVHRKKVHNLTGPMPKQNNQNQPKEPELVNIEILPDVAANTVISDTDTIPIEQVKPHQIAYKVSYKVNNKKKTAQPVRGRKKKGTPGFLTEYMP